MKFSRARLAAPVALVAALVTGGSLAAAVPAIAAPGDDALVFNHPTVVPGYAAYDNLIDSLEAASLNVVEFAGGDAAAWTTALAGIEVVVFPDFNGGSPFYGPGSVADAWLPAAAGAVLKDWTQAGGTVVLSGRLQYASQDELTTLLTDVDFTDAYESSGYDPEATRVVADPALPQTVPAVVGLYVHNLNDWTPDQRAAFTPWYTDALGYAWVGTLTAGAGQVGIMGYDFYESPAPVDECAPASDAEYLHPWQQVLSVMVDGGPIAPLADTWTGSDIPLDIEVNHGDILGNGTWSGTPERYVVSGRPAGTGVELDGTALVDYSDGFGPCFFVDVDPDAQTITVWGHSVSLNTYGALSLSVSSPEFVGVQLVSDDLFVSTNSPVNWVREWNYSGTTLSASWNADLSSFGAADVASRAYTVPGRSAVFSYQLAGDTQLAATGVDDVAPWLIGALAVIVLGASGLVIARRTSSRTNV